jgi:hypothetical protein
VVRAAAPAAVPDVAAVARAAADPRDAQIARLRKEKARLEQELARARFVVDVQAKLQALLDCVADRSGW